MWTRLSHLAATVRETAALAVRLPLVPRLAQGETPADEPTRALARGERVSLGIGVLSGSPLGDALLGDAWIEHRALSGWLAARWAAPEGTRMVIYVVDSAGATHELATYVPARGTRVTFTLPWTDTAVPVGLLVAIARR
jgi:hypothetical protein